MKSNPNMDTNADRPPNRSTAAVMAMRKADTTNPTGFFFFFPPDVVVEDDAAAAAVSGVAAAVPFFRFSRIPFRTGFNVDRASFRRVAQTSFPLLLSNPPSPPVGLARSGLRPPWRGPTWTVRA
jgi:hypothetical protein